MHDRGRGQVPAVNRLPSTDLVLRLLHRCGFNRALTSGLSYQDVPNQERYPADGEHVFNDENHRRAVRMLRLILGARVATADRPLWSREITDVTRELQIPEPALTNVLVDTNKIPPE